MGGWFYRGAKKVVAHWIDSSAEAPLCKRVRLSPDGFVMRHPVHDRRVPLCGHCRALLLARKALNEDCTESQVGVENKGAP
jgi:hypothetical protein